MLTVLDLSQEDIQFNRKASTRREKKGPCPGCGGNDRFSVKQDETGRWVFMCRGCWDSQEVLSHELAKVVGKQQRVGEKRGWGDEIDYLRHYRKMTYQQARAFVGDPCQEQRVQVQQARATNWQEAIATSVKESETRLWSADDTTALDYIRGRGLGDETIKGAHLGYSVKDGIPRLIIPSYNDGRYVAVYRRDLRADIGRSERWKDVAGSTKDELYLADCLQIRRPTVLVESPICALTIVQECTGLVNVIATGGVDGAHSPKSLAQLAIMPLILVAFDADTAGDGNAPWWMTRLPNARRLRPYLKDINDMLTDGWDIRAWIEQAIHDQDTSTPGETPELPGSDAETIVPASSTHEQDSIKTVPSPAPIPTICSNRGQTTDFVETIVSAPTHEPLAQGEYEDPLNFCCKCGALVDEIMEVSGHLVGYCTEHLPSDYRVLPHNCPTFTPRTSDPQDNPIVQAVSKQFDASIVEVMPRSAWEQRKAELLQRYREQGKRTRFERDRTKWLGKSNVPESVWFALDYGNAYQDRGESSPMDYTEWLYRKPLMKNYYKAFEDTEQALLNRVQTPRVYACPVPRYGYREDGTFGQIEEMSA